MAVFLEPDDFKESPRTAGEGKILTKKPSDKLRRLWVQGRKEGNWCNIESLDDDKAALDLVHRSFHRGLYDAVRILESLTSTQSGETIYRAQLTVIQEQGRLIYQNGDESAPSVLVAPPPTQRVQEEKQNFDNPKQDNPSSTLAPPIEVILQSTIAEQLAMIREKVQSAIQEEMPKILAQEKAHLSNGESAEKKPLFKGVSITATPIRAGKRQWQVSESPAVPILPPEDAKLVNPQKAETPLVPAPSPLPKAEEKVEVKAEVKDEAKAEIVFSDEGQETPPLPTNWQSSPPALYPIPHLDEKETLRTPAKKTALRPVEPIAHIYPDSRLYQKEPEFIRQEEEISDFIGEKPRAVSMAARGRNPYGAIPARRENKAGSPSKKRSNGLMSGLLVGVIASAGAFGFIGKESVLKVATKFEQGISRLLPEPDVTEAVKRQNPVLVRELLQKGSDANSRDRNGDPSLLLAARNNDLVSLNLLMQAGADPKLLDGSGQTIMHRLAAEGRGEALEILLKLGAPVDLIKKGDCKTPLSVAAEYGHIRAVQTLAEYGAILEPLKNCAKAPKDFAANAQTSSILQEIIVKRAEKNQRNQQTAALSPESQNDGKNKSDFEEKLIKAIKAGDKQAASQLLKSKPAFVDLKEMNLLVSTGKSTGYKSLTDYAFLHGKWDIGRELTKQGLGYSPDILHQAIDDSDRAENAELAKFLISLGGDLNGTHLGLTPLMRASVRNRGELVESLLKAGADPSIATSKGETAATMAALTGNKELMESLIIAEKEDGYRAVMGNLSWRDSLKNIEAKSDVCTDLPDGFRACRLKNNQWLSHKNTIIIAMFDKLANNRLISLQIDGGLTNNPVELKKTFDKVAKEIGGNIPASHNGFTDKRETPGVGFFQGFLGKDKKHEFYSYWSDEDQTRPAFIHLKIQADSSDQGGFRVKIGNPFRSG